MNLRVFGCLLLASALCASLSACGSSCHNCGHKLGAVAALRQTGTDSAAQAYARSRPEQSQASLHGVKALAVDGRIQLHLTQGGREQLRVEGDPASVKIVRKGEEMSITTDSPSAAKTTEDVKVYANGEPGVTVTGSDGQGHRVAVNRSTKPVIVRATVKDLKALRVDGAAHVVGKLLKTDALRIVASGAANVNLGLRVDSLVVEADGAPTLKLHGSAVEQALNFDGAPIFHAADLKARNCRVQADGAASLDLNCTERLFRSLAGASEVRNSGPARAVDSQSDVT